MNLFGQGLRDELLIATRAVEQEVTVTNIWSQRDSAVLKATVTETWVKASNDNRVWQTTVVPPRHRPWRLITWEI